MTQVDVFSELIKGRLAYPVGTIRTGKDGVKRRKVAEGKWVPVKKRRKYESGATRTKDGKRYRMGEDGKWRRTKTRKKPKEKVVSKPKEKSEKQTVRSSVDQAVTDFDRAFEKPEDTSETDADSKLMERLRSEDFSTTLVNSPEKRTQHQQRQDYVDLNKLPDAVVSYFVNAHEEINSTLRSGGDVTENVEIETDETDDGIDNVPMIDVINELKAAMSPVSEEIQVFRGINKLLPSEVNVIPLSSFTSSSTNLDVAGYFARRNASSGDGATLLSFTVPEGTEALVANDAEQEVVLPPDKMLEVEERIERDDGVVVLQCRLVSK